MVVQLKRVYESTDSADGARFLVERLWPRGLKKADLKLDAWLKDVAPSTVLRQWFAHDPEKWKEFCRRYFLELRANEGVLQPIVQAARKGPVTLLYSSHDQEHNNAVALRDYLQAKKKTKGSRRKQAA
jgi:uncharacterized protein YeaO (DUF488 family)